MENYGTCDDKVFCFTFSLRKDHLTQKLHLKCDNHGLQDPNKSRILLSKWLYDQSVHMQYSYEMNELK